MKTRTQKYKKYREKILRTPDDKFESKQTRRVEVTKEEVALETPYTIYHQKEMKNYALKGVIFFIALVLFMILFLFWVRD